MKILLSGATGFIGANFKSRYTHKYEIIPYSFRHSSVARLDLNNIDTVIHLGAIVHQPKATKEIYDEINIRKTLEFCQKSKVSGVKHFIFMSTIAVHNEALVDLHEISDELPATLYGESKLKTEKQLKALEDEHFKISIIRAPMVYGYNAPGNIKSLMHLIDKVAILPFGGISNKRSFVYVGNLCAMIDCIIQKRQSGVFLASDDKALSTTQLIESIAKAKKKSCYLFKLPFFAEFLRWIKPALYKRLFESLEVDNTQTKKVLGFENPYSIQEGIALMVDGEKL